MKKTLVSLAAASLIASTAMAADKGIDIVTTGQTVLYYQTESNNGDNYKNLNKGAVAGTPVTADKADNSLFNQDQAKANVGVQLNLDADLKNGFTFGSQLSYIGTSGVEKNLVGGTMQNVGNATKNEDLTDEIALTKIFVAKKIANTTIKIGRQELPKSLSPFAFSEDWNVFKNTFEAALVVNTDIPDTTLVGAYVGQSNKHGDIADFGNLTTSGATIDSTAYMLTVQNKSVPMTTITATYYDLAEIGVAATAGTPTIVNSKWVAAATTAAVKLEGASIMWADAQVAGKDLPLGLKVGLQGGVITTQASALADTSAYGIKVGLAPIDALSLCVAYTSVDGDDNKDNVAMKNAGTGVKTPLFTQMVANQDAIALDGDTIMLKAAYNTGDYGTIIAQGTFTSAGKRNMMGSENDYTDLELIYKIKAGEVDFLAAYVNQSWDKKKSSLNYTSATAVSDYDNNNIVRVWARYNF